MVVAIVALITALGGSAIAGGVLNKKKVNKIITNREPGLSVTSCKNAGNEKRRRWASRRGMGCTSSSNRSM